MICNSNYEWELKIKDAFMNKTKFKKMSYKLKEHAYANYSDTTKTSAWRKLFSSL